MWYKDSHPPVCFLISVDAEWVKKKIVEIFPDTPDQQPLRDVAWEAYLTANQAYDKAFEILRSQYSRAVEEIGKTKYAGQGHMLGEADMKLGHHLMQLYWRGRIGVEEGGVISELYKRASDALMGEIVTYVGRSISNTKDVSPELLQRFVELWDYHLSRTSQSNRIREMAAFGWWFNSGHFEDGWAIEHLYRSLQLSNGEMDPKLGTLQRLAKLAEKYPELVISCTKLIVEAELVDVILWVEDLRNILKLVLRSGGDAAKKTRSVIQTLGIRGHLGYRDLLP